MWAHCGVPAQCLVGLSAISELAVPLWDLNITSQEEDTLDNLVVVVVCVVVVGTKQIKHEGPVGA